MLAVSSALIFWDTLLQSEPVSYTHLDVYKRQALGVELFQLDGDGNHKVIAFASRSLVASEKKYTITEK